MLNFGWMVSRLMVAHIGRTFGAPSRTDCQRPEKGHTVGMAYFQSNLAEGKGFEPPEPCGSSDFESDAIDHSATPPIQDC
jgi:hypothetical protein